jgi:hypothetical protein
MKTTLTFLAALAAMALAGSIFPSTTTGYALTTVVLVVVLYPLVGKGFTAQRYAWFSIGMVLVSTLFYKLVQPYIPESYVQGMTAGILLTGVIGALATRRSERT